MQTRGYFIDCCISNWYHAVGIGAAQNIQKSAFTHTFSWEEEKKMCPQIGNLRLWTQPHTHTHILSHVYLYNMKINKILDP